MASSGSEHAVKLVADAQGALRFHPAQATAQAGRVTVSFYNPSSVPHGVVITGHGMTQAGEIVNHGGRTSRTVTLEPGRYVYYCPVPSHRASGMTGVLTVH